MLKKEYILLLVLMTFSHLSLFSQDTIINVDNRDESFDKGDLMKNIKLPPLSEFFKNVHTHPSVGIYETYKEEAFAELGEEKQKWLDYLKVGANYQYGNNYTLESINTFSSNTANSSYGVGLSLAIPIGNIVSRDKRIKSKRAIYRRVQYEYELAVEERKLMILEAYNAVVEQRATIKVKSESAALYNAQMKISEVDFKMGKISIMTLSTEHARRVTAIVSYEEAKVALYNAMILLEMLSDVKILNN